MIPILPTSPQVSATDPDCGVNAIVNYTMGDGLGKYREFEVNPSSGEICISAPLDHEKRSIYEFPVLATDRGIVLRAKSLHDKM